MMIIEIRCSNGVTYVASRKRKFMSGVKTPSDLPYIIKTLMRMNNVDICMCMRNSFDDVIDVDHVPQSMWKYKDNNYSKILVVFVILFQ